MTALTAIPFEVWLAIVGFGVVVGIAGALIAAALREDDETQQRSAHHAPVSDLERHQRIRAEAREWGARR